MILLHFFLRVIGSDSVSAYEIPTGLSMILSMAFVTFLIVISMMIYEFLKCYFRKRFQGIETLRIDDSYIRVFKEVEKEMFEYNIAFKKIDIDD